MANEINTKPEALTLTITAVTNMDNANKETGQCYPDRLAFQCKERFTTLRNGEETETNYFSLKWFNAVQQLSALNQYIQLANIMAKGNRPNTQVLALILANATIEVQREYKQKGEQREGGQPGEIYNADVYKHTITKVHTNISPMFEQLIMQLIQTNPCEPQPAPTAVPTMPNFKQVTA